MKPKLRPPMRRPEGMIAVYLAVLLGVILILMGFTGSLQVSMGRAMLERILVYREIDLAAASCFEEVSGKLEQQLSGIPFPKLLVKRDLNSILAWPDSVDPTLTKAEFAPRGVTLEPVTFRTSPFLNFQAQDQDGSLIAVERGFIEMKVKVRARRGRIRIGREVTCRRIVYAEPVNNAPTLSLRIQSADLFRAVVNL